MQSLPQAPRAELAINIEVNIEDIRNLILEEKIQWRNYILIRMRQRGIKINDVIDSLMNGVVCKGKLIEGKVNHIVDIDGHIIIVKNVPANICTQCGEYYINHKIAIIIEELIDRVLINYTEIMIINYPSVV